jgi:hypothetical protein
METYPHVKERSLYTKTNFIPDRIELGFDNFPEFLEERNKLIAKKLNDVLGNVDTLVDCTTGETL